MLYHITKNPLTPGTFPEPDGNKEPLSEKEAVVYGLEQEQKRWRDEPPENFPELSMYGEDYRLDLCREDPNPDAEVYEIVFEVGEPQTRYYCVIDGCDSLLEALGMFFRDHPNVTYGMIFETLSM